MTNLVLVHGRAQQQRDAAGLKGEWLTALDTGLAKSGLELPILEEAIRFPYYGDTLWDLVSGAAEADAADVIVKGEEAVAEESAFVAAMIDEVRRGVGITDEQVREVLVPEVLEKGPLGWEWAQAVLRAIDRFVPLGSGTAVALFTRDVYLYLTHPGIRDRIESGVLRAIDPEVPTVVVGHSLGSVVAYNLLQREGQSRGWQVPLFVTVGSPLGIKAIKQRLAPIRHPPCAQRWINAMDERDVVALYPLTARHFPVDPPIENRTDVRNDTPNHHGIAGYLGDRQVARRIAEAVS